MMSGSVLMPVRATFRAVAETVVPEASSLTPDAWRELEEVVERALAARPERTRRQLVTFLRLVELLPLLRHFRRFTRLSPDGRFHVLAGLQSSRQLALRRGLWGVRTLVLMGYYSREDVQAALGYRAHKNGWSARRTSGEVHAAAADDGDVDARRA